MIQEISALKKCRKIVKLNSACCMSKRQVRASYATIAVKFSSPEYPLKSWSSAHLKSLYDGGSALKQRCPLPRLAFLSPPSHQLQRLGSWRGGCLCHVGRENGERGDAAKPTPFSSTNGLNWSRGHISKHGDGSLHPRVFGLALMPTTSARSSVKTHCLSQLLSKCGG